MSDTFAEGEFICDLPVWVIIDPKPFRQGDLSAAIATLTAPDIGQLVPMYTDDDLAKEAVKHWPSPGKAAAKIEKREALKFVLRNQKQKGMTHAAIDLDVVKLRGRFIAIDELIEKIDG